LRPGGTGLDTSDSDESGEKEDILLAILGYFPGFGLVADREDGDAPAKKV
jgi:hypothetical protein